MKLGIGIVLLMLGALVAIAGIRGVGASFVVGANLGGGSGIKPLDFIASNFRLICALQIPVGFLIFVTGGVLIHSGRKEKDKHR